MNCLGTINSTFLKFMFLMMLPLKNKVKLVTSITFCSNFSNVFKSRTQSIVLFESYNIKIKFHDHIDFHEIISSSHNLTKWN